MDEEQFRTAAHQLVDYMISYLQNIRTRYLNTIKFFRFPILKITPFECRRVLSNVTPGYMRELIPGEAPEQGESWQDIFRDIEQAIMPGVGSNRFFSLISHWN